MHLHTKGQLGEITKTLGYDLKRFKIVRCPHTLFPPDWSMLDKNACPYCYKPLRRMWKHPDRMICNNHKENSFVVKYKELPL